MAPKGLALPHNLSCRACGGRGSPSWTLAADDRSASRATESHGEGFYALNCRGKGARPPAIAYSRVDTGPIPSAVPSNSNFQAPHSGLEHGLIAECGGAFLIAARHAARFTMSRDRQKDYRKGGGGGGLHARATRYEARRGTPETPDGPARPSVHPRSAKTSKLKFHYV